MGLFYARSPAQILITPNYKNMSTLTFESILVGVQMNREIQLLKARYAHQLPPHRGRTKAQADFLEQYRQMRIFYDLDEDFVHPDYLPAFRCLMNRGVGESIGWSRVHFNMRHMPF